MIKKVAPTIIIYPTDRTTRFLGGIIEHLEQEVSGTDRFIVFKVKTSERSHLRCKELISNAEEGTTIIFLGHGTSYSLSGAWSRNFARANFITKDDKALFKGKKLLFLSCRSNEFLKDIYDTSIISCLGFGDLPTEWDEIISARELDVNAYAGFTQVVLDEFKKCLVDILKFCLEDSFKFNLTFEELFYRFRLRLNKRISSYIFNNKAADFRILSNLLYDVKNEMILLGSHDAKFLSL